VKILYSEDLLLLIGHSVSIHLLLAAPAVPTETASILRAVHTRSSLPYRAGQKSIE